MQFLLCYIVLLTTCVNCSLSHDCFLVRNRTYCCECKQTWICTDKNFCPSTTIPVSTTTVTPGPSSSPEPKPMEKHFVLFVVLLMSMCSFSFALLLCWRHRTPLIRWYNLFAAEIRRRIYLRMGWSRVEMHEPLIEFNHLRRYDDVVYNP